MVSALNKRNSKSARQISESIAGLNAKLVMLDGLRSKGYLDTDVYKSQTMEIKKKLSELKSERHDSFESKITGMASEVRKLESLIQAIDAPLEEFDGKLFNEIVVGMTINNMDELTITLIGGLEFTERI